MPTQTHFSSYKKPWSLLRDGTRKLYPETNIWEVLGCIRGWLKNIKVLNLLFDTAEYFCRNNKRILRFLDFMDKANMPYSLWRRK